MGDSGHELVIWARKSQKKHVIYEPAVLNLLVELDGKDVATNSNSPSKSMVGR